MKNITEMVLDPTHDGEVRVTETVPTLKARMGTGGNQIPLIFEKMNGEYVVRRLTPIECERLQGFPDNWTQIPYKGKPKEKCPDSPRYKAIGNSWAVPCVRYLGRLMDAELKEKGYE
jgi:DNA (cytosine-5)-methyltransferase 1